jgi:hypothetical protein
MRATRSAWWWMQVRVLPEGSGVLAVLRSEPCPPRGMCCTSALLRFAASCGCACPRACRCPWHPRGGHHGGTLPRGPQQQWRGARQGLRRAMLASCSCSWVLRSVNTFGVRQSPRWRAARRCVQLVDGCGLVPAIMHAHACRRPDHQLQNWRQPIGQHGDRHRCASSSSTFHTLGQASGAHAGARLNWWRTRPRCQPCQAARSGDLQAS